MTVPVKDDPVARELVAFLENKTRAPWSVERDLFAEGGLSSLFALELVVFLEKTFDVSIGGSDLQLVNFRTVVSMVELVHRLKDGNG
ncbi:acyl carrier protein [Streptomyces tsukubensis]|uniref:Methoxymalonate biosynthesis protein n=1 Tax=Streptomyces tsukubensis TaxID=83656 RepID=A0A1V3ZYQ1_9ACTN|nr:acyl carrier protein [Streptomyces tsukubensis]OON71510.1 methoxymalonate biosynthesis protein [Streptomyces tsukubensis]QFR96908.1 acyl carrier protein [Streptomyces tsukubensis]